MREGRVFIIRRRTHVDVRKAGTIRERDMITARSDNTLKTAVTPRSLMDMNAKGAKLSSRVDGMAFAIVSILMHENNDGTAMSLNVSCSGNERKVEDSAIADTADVGFVKVRGGYDADIGTRHPTISTTVHQGARRRG
jgi:hypothetical protein